MEVPDKPMAQKMEMRKWEEKVITYSRLHIITWGCFRVYTCSVVVVVVFLLLSYLKLSIDKLHYLVMKRYKWDQKWHVHK